MKLFDPHFPMAKAGLSPYNSMPGLSFKSEKHAIL